MTDLKKALLLLLLFNCFSAFAQTLPIAVNLQNTYTKGTRTLNGAPGKNYWQNKADYFIKVNFNPKSRDLTGTVVIDYVNNSPDTLMKMEFKLYPNLFKKGSVRNMPVADSDITDGVKIQRLSINQQDRDTSQWSVIGTNMTVKVIPILPRQKVHFEIDYSYTLNKGSHIRTGQVDTGAFLWPISSRALRYMMTLMAGTKTTIAVPKSFTTTLAILILR